MKPRSDSKLKNLPDERQDQIAEWCLAEKTEDCPGGLQHAKEQLAADGLSVSVRALSEWFAWYRRRELFRAADAKARDTEEFLKKEFTELTPEKIAAAGQLVFTMSASNAGDTESFVALENLRLQQQIAKTNAEFEKQKIAIRTAAEQRAREKLNFEREKWIEMSCQKILLAARDAKTREIAESNVSNAEKIAALRQAYFSDVDAMPDLELPT